MPVNKGKDWLLRHKKDRFVKQAQQQGYVARSAFKLLEAKEKYHLFYRAKQVIDLGAAPGAWLQVCVKQRQIQGLVACDLLPLHQQLNLKSYPFLHFVQGDFNEKTVQAQLLALSPSFDLVLSDMAPNLTGIQSVDDEISADLVMQALVFAKQNLTPRGRAFIKFFHGTGSQALLDYAKSNFSEVKTFKPKSSRDQSRENYFVLSL